MTDAEKLIITTIDTSLTADLIDSGTYKLDDLKTLFATHIARFEAAYSSTSSVRIMRYLRARARDFKVDPPSFSKTKGKSKTTSPSKRVRPSPQRTWRGTEQHIQSSMPCTNQHCVTMNIAHTLSIEECKNKYSRIGTPGNGKGSVGKGKGKDGKGRGKGSKGGKGMGKGKGKGKGKGHTRGLGLQLPLQTSASSFRFLGWQDNHQLGRCHMLLLPPERTLQVSAPKMVGSSLIIVLSTHATTNSAIGSHS
jgi:hypothetical protein